MWDGCAFHYLKTDETSWQLDDGSVANVSENPDALPPKDKECTHPRNPTATEMAAKDARGNRGERQSNAAGRAAGVLTPCRPVQGRVTPAAPLDNLSFATPPRRHGSRPPPAGMTSTALPVPRREGVLASARNSTGASRRCEGGP